MSEPNEHMEFDPEGAEVVERKADVMKLCLRDIVISATDRLAAQQQACFGALVLSLFDMERYRIPMVISNQTYVFSAVIAIASAVLAGLAVRMHLHLFGRDLVEAAPKPILEKVNKETADKAKAALEGAGATVTVK